jgi:hypothetical protein
MTVRHGSIAVLVALALTTVTHGQTVSTTGSNASSLLANLSSITATQPADKDTDLRATVFKSILDTLIQDIFTSLRGSLGLPAASTGATDPLTLLETLVTDLANAKLNN